MEAGHRRSSPGGPQQEGEELFEGRRALLGYHARLPGLGLDFWEDAEVQAPKPDYRNR